MHHLYKPQSICPSLKGLSGLRLFFFFYPISEDLRVFSKQLFYLNPNGFFNVVRTAYPEATMSIRLSRKMLFEAFYDPTQP